MAMGLTFVSVFGLFFPAALLLGGAYLAYRGLSRLSPDRAARGKISCPEPALSHASRIPCAYCRTVVERHGGGSRWIPLLVMEKRARFRVGRERFLKATFEVSRSNVYKGYAEGAPRGLARRIGGALSKARSGVFQWLARHPLVPKGGNVRALLMLFDDPESFGAETEIRETDRIPKAVVSSILSYPEAAEVRANLSRPLRIREYVLPVGASVVVLGRGEPFVSDLGEADARAALRERSLLGIVAGATFMLVAALAALFMIL